MPISMRRHELWSLEHATYLTGSEDAARAAAAAFNRQIGGGCSWDIDAGEIHYGLNSDGLGLDACDALRTQLCAPVASVA